MKDIRRVPTYTQGGRGSSPCILGAGLLAADVAGVVNVLRDNLRGTLNTLAIRAFMADFELGRDPQSTKRVKQR